MDGLDFEAGRLDKAEERINEKEEEIREKGRKEGRRIAYLAIQKVDQIFTPRMLNPDDSKVLFHPIDFVVFNGMKNSESMENIVLLDRKTESPEHRRLQESIERVIEKRSYEWLTLRIDEDGSISEE